MATPTAQQLENTVNSSIGSKAVKISRYRNIDATYDMWYCTVNKRGAIGALKAGKSCWCRTTVADILALQAVAIQTALRSDGNVDPNLQ